MSLFSSPPRIASRSAAPPPTLSEPFCLRCSKRVASRLEGGFALACGWRGNEQKCEYCAGPTIKKKCDTIPQQYVVTFNDLLAAARAWDGEDQDELGRLQRLQASYTRGVEAHIRHMRKAGLSRPPTNSTEAGMAVFGVLSRMADTLDNINDVLRFQAHLPPIVREPGEEADTGDNA
ncbi:hypothetical protein DV736_g2118, partial [Chaetothyriales sp. CBS 134916]